VVVVLDKVAGADNLGRLDLAEVRELVIADVTVPVQCLSRSIAHHGVAPRLAGVLPPSEAEEEEAEVFPFTSVVEAVVGSSHGPRLTDEEGGAVSLQQAT
jgi:hypothetical protein